MRARGRVWSVLALPWLALFTIQYLGALCARRTLSRSGVQTGVTLGSPGELVKAKFWVAGPDEEGWAGLGICIPTSQAGSRVWLMLQVWGPHSDPLGWTQHSVGGCAKEPQGGDCLSPWQVGPGHTQGTTEAA